MSTALPLQPAVFPRDKSYDEEVVQGLPVLLEVAISILLGSLTHSLLHVCRVRILYMVR